MAAVKAQDVARAWAAYVSDAPSFDVLDMNALVKLCGRFRRHRLLQQLWRSVRERRHPVALDAHMASTFISAFRNCGDLSALRDVIEATRAEFIVNTRVCNSYLAACLRLSSENPAALAAAEALLADMRSSGTHGEALDSFSVALGVAILGRAGNLTAARALVEESDELVDVVGLNSLIDAAAREGDVHLALATLEGMEAEGSRHAPDEKSYTAALQALVHCPKSGSMAIDRVAAAEELRNRMLARGISESAATRTSLLNVFADTALAEAVLEDAGSAAAALNPGQRYPSLPPMPDDVRSSSLCPLCPLYPLYPFCQLAPTAICRRPRVHAYAQVRFITDLRGLTRQAITIMLRADMQLTGEARELGTAACGYGGSWAIVTGAPLPSERGNPSPAAVADTQLPSRQPVTVRSAIEFLATEGIEFEQSRGLIVVKAEALEVAATEAAKRTRQQTVRKGLLLQLSLVASGIAAMSVIPRLLDGGAVLGGAGC